MSGPEIRTSMPSPDPLEGNADNVLRQNAYDAELRRILVVQWLMNSATVDGILAQAKRHAETILEEMKTQQLSSPPEPRGE